MKSFEHQDWEPVVIRSKENLKQTNSIKKQNPIGTKNFQELNKDDIPVLNKITKQQQQVLVQGRNAKGLTRKQLASALNLQESVITHYENGTIKLFNKGLYNRLLRFLGVNE